MEVDFSLLIDYSDEDLRSNGTITVEGVERDIVFMTDFAARLYIFYTPDMKTQVTWEELVFEFPELSQESEHDIDADYKKELEQRCIWSKKEPLYIGELRYKNGLLWGNFDAGKGLIFRASEWIDEEWVEIGEYTFISEKGLSAKIIFEQAEFIVIIIAAIVSIMLTFISPIVLISFVMKKTVSIKKDKSP